MGGLWSPSTYFCVYVVALSVYRARNVWDQVVGCRSISNGDQQLCMNLDDQTH
jgi:hypothetical protein